MPRIARRDIRYTHSREGSGERKATSLNAEGAAPISFSMARFPNIFPRRGSRAGLLPCAGRLAACLLAGMLLKLLRLGEPRGGPLLGPARPFHPPRHKPPPGPPPPRGTPPLNPSTTPAPPRHPPPPATCPGSPPRPPETPPP